MSVISGSKKNTYLCSAKWNFPHSRNFSLYRMFSSVDSFYSGWRLWVCALLTLQKWSALRPQGGNVWAFCPSVETNFFWAAIRGATFKTNTAKFLPCLQRLPLSSYHNWAKTSHNPTKVTILKNFKSMFPFLLAIFLRDVKFQGCQQMCAIFHGHWLRGDGWMGRGRIDSTLSLFPLPPILLLPSIQLHLCFRAALSSGGIPSYQTKCIRTFSLQIWKFLWPLCLKFWFQSSKQWPTSCCKGCCYRHKQKCENSNISRWW